MGKTAIVITIIIVALVAGLLITGFIVIAQKGTTKQTIIGEDSNMTLYLSAQDSKSKASLDSNYVVEYEVDQTTYRFSQGELTRGSFTEILEIPREKALKIYVWDNNHYLSKETKIFNDLEKKNNVSKITLNLDKIGKLDIEQKGSIKEGISKIEFHLTSIKGNYNKVGAVLTWTPGILDVYLEQDFINCNKGFWANHSTYNQTTQEYMLLPKDEFRCGLDEYELCKSTIGVKCYPFENKMPSRFLGKADKTIYIGKSLKEGEIYSFNLTIKTLDNANVLDYLDITFFDNDKRWNEESQKWILVSEINGKDLGGEDYSSRIDYTR